MDDILHCGWMARFPEWNTYQSQCSVPKLHGRNNVKKKHRFLQRVVCQNLKEAPGIHIHTHIYVYTSYIIMFISMQIHFGKCLDKFLSNLSRARHIIMSHQTPLKSSKHLSVPFRSERPLMVGEWEKIFNLKSLGHFRRFHYKYIPFPGWVTQNEITSCNHEINFLRSACLMGKTNNIFPK